MTSISTLRQIVTDIHSVAPQGLRKVLRTELAERMSRPSTIKSNLRFRSNVYKKALDIFNRPFDLSYLTKIYDKEQNMLIKKTIKNLGIKVENKTNRELLS